MSSFGRFDKVMVRLFGSTSLIGVSILCACGSRHQTYAHTHGCGHGLEGVSMASQDCTAKM